MAYVRQKYDLEGYSIVDEVNNESNDSGQQKGSPQSSRVIFLTAAATWAVSVLVTRYMM